MLAGLDIGTTNAKFSIYTEKGTLIAEASERYSSAKEGNIPLAEVIWGSVCRIIQKAGCESGAKQKITGLAVATFGEAVIPIGKNGRVLYEDFDKGIIDTEEELKQIRSCISDERICEITGLIPQKKFPLAKILWYKNHTEIYKHTCKFLQMEDFVLWRLTGRFVVSDSIASRSMIYDRKKKCWSEEILNAVGVEKEKMPEIVPSGSYVGKVKETILEQLGLKGPVKVFAGGHDQMCNTVGAGISATNTLVNCSGTVECVSGMTDKKIENNFTEGLMLSQFPFPLKEKNFYFWAPVAGCSSLDWGLHLLNGKKIQEKDIKVLHVAMQKQCTKKPSKIMTFPYFGGRNAPDLYNDAKGIMWGLDLSTEPREIYQSILEGIVFELKLCKERLATTFLDIQEIIAVGGGAQSDYWVQMKSTIMGCPLRRLKHVQAGTMGCMLLAAVGDGYYTSLAEAMEVCVETKDTFWPEEQYKDLYDEKYHKYVELRKRLF